MTEKLLTINDLASRWRVHRNTIHTLVRKGELVSVRIGNRHRFRESDIEAYLARDQRHRNGKP